MTDDMIKLIMENRRELFEAMAKGATEVRKPTEEYNEYYIWAIHHHEDQTKHYGKWLVFADDKYIDAMWTRVREATLGGMLGPVSKVSTMRNYPEHGQFVICVYNNDYHDLAEIQRIKEALIGLGVSPERYKTDYETINGQPPDDYYDARV